MPHLWSLLDTSPGHSNQVKAIAALMTGFNVVEKPLSYNSLAKLPTCIIGSSIITLDSTVDMTPPWPDIVIASGRKTLPIALYIKKKSPATKLIYSMWPGYKIAQKCDLVIVPEHDHITAQLPHIVTITGALHHIDEASLKAAKTKWNIFESTVKNTVLMIGGGTRAIHFGEKELAHYLSLSIDQRTKDERYLISTSRRSPAIAAETIRTRMQKNDALYTPESPEENPYLGYLSHATKIIVSGDSISMCSEACATGKAVFIFDTIELPKKHRSFLNTLYESDIARPLSHMKNEPNWKPNGSLNTIERVKEGLNMLLGV